MRDDLDIEVIEAGALDRRQPWWLVALALGLAAVLGVLLVVLIMGRDDSTGLVVGELDCGAGVSGSVSRGSENGVSSPGQAMEVVATMPWARPTDPSEWQNEGLVADLDGSSPDVSDGSYLYVKRDGDDVVGQIVVSPAGTGWWPSSAIVCPQ